MTLGKRERLFRDLWDQLREELRLLKNANGTHKVPANVLQQFDVPPHPLDASDVYKIESTLLEYLDDQGLRIRLLMFRDMLANVLTNDSYRLLESVLIKDLAAGNRTPLVEEARALACRLYRRYVLVPNVESLKASLATKLVYWVLGANALLLFLAFWDSSHVESWVLAACAGSMGAMVSTIRRLYQFDTRHEPLLTWLSLEKGRFSIWISPVLGAFFGLVLLFVFRSELISGELFPDLDSSAWRGLDVVQHKCDTSSKKCLDQYFQIAKVIVWCFVAGWAERMVPDVLNKLANEPLAHMQIKPPQQ